MARLGVERKLSECTQIKKGRAAFVLFDKVLNLKLSEGLITDFNESESGLVLISLKVNK